jgi:hypothetical protein
MIGAGVGLLTLLSALALGLLIWTSYGVYAGQNMTTQTLAAKFLQLDLALAELWTGSEGPTAATARRARQDDRRWLGRRRERGKVRRQQLRRGSPQQAYERCCLGRASSSTDAQKQALAVAKATSETVGQSRLQMSSALAAPVSYPLMTVVAWTVLLFCGFGLMSKGHAMSVVAVFVGSCAAASAVYLILDLSSPYSGVFGASSAPLQQVVAVMGKE